VSLVPSSQPRSPTAHRQRVISSTMVARASAQRRPHNPQAFSMQAAVHATYSVIDKRITIDLALVQEARMTLHPGILQLCTVVGTWKVRQRAKERER